MGLLDLGLLGLVLGLVLLLNVAMLLLLLHLLHHRLLLVMMQGHLILHRLGVLLLVGLRLHVGGSSSQIGGKVVHVDEYL
jgi:hypothetical protein